MYQVWTIPCCGATGISYGMSQTRPRVHQTTRLARILRFFAGSFVKGPQENIMNRKKILVVDDDRVILKALSIKLNAKGYDVLTATDGSEAVTAVRTHKPDLILLDISFPPDL